MTIEEKYNIHYVNGKRYYEFDLSTKVAVLDNTIPFYFRYKNFETYESAWGKIALSILNHLDLLEPKSEEYLLGLKYPWNGKVIFSAEKRINFIPFKGIFLNANHSSTHAMMSIQEILRIYNVDISECRFLIKRHHTAEPEEAREYYRTKKILTFSKFLKLKKISQQNIETIIKNVFSLNKILSKTSSGYDDFFLFEDLTYFLNYKLKVVELSNKLFFNKPNNLRIVDMTLAYLEDLYRNYSFYMNLELIEVSSDLPSLLEEEILFLSKSLNSSVISASKMFSRMALLHKEKIDTLKELNTVKDLFKYASIVLADKFYFSEPFISLDNNRKLTNEEVLIEYIYKQDEFTINQLNTYIEKMHLKKQFDFLALIETISGDYVQVDSEKFIKKNILDFPTEFIESIDKELTYYINSFGDLVLDNYLGYSQLPQNEIVWSREFIVGIVRSFIPHKFKIAYKNNSFRKPEFITFML